MFKSFPPIRASLVALALATVADAQPGAAHSQTAYRHHLSTLVDAGHVSALVTSWPNLSSNALDAQLDAIDPSALDAQSRAALAFLSAARPDGERSLRLQIGSAVEPLRGFASASRRESELQFALADAYGPVRGRLQASLFDPEFRGDSPRLDGSYLATDIGQWRLGIGQIDRWWGPGWQSSLILSRNAAPSPGLFFTRNTTAPTDLPLVRRLGPWHLELFANQLEHDRAVPEAKLLGARFTFRPARHLEIGLSRTAQWAGQGRPSGLSSLWDLILGNDNRGQGGIDLDGSNEPGNQLGGIDARWTFRAFERPITVYGQLIGEDEAGGLPSREIGLIGMETPLDLPGVSGRLFLEAADTTMNFLNDPMPNSAYNHTIYRSGYRYYGDPIGASQDNDSRSLALGGYHEFGDGARFALDWKAVYAHLNRDGAPANHSLAPTAIDTAMLSGGLSAALNDSLSARLSGFLLSDELRPSYDQINKGIQLSMTLSR